MNFKIKVLITIFSSLIFHIALFSQNSSGTFETSSSQSSTSKDTNSSQISVYTPEQEKLKLSSDDVRLVKDLKNGGFHLYVRKLKNVESILLTETTKDPTGKNDNYAYRASEYNSINGDEIRYLDGKQLVSEGAKYSLIDSTVEKTSFFGDAFHIYIPPVIYYGYPWTRHGEVTIGKGTFINIRTFEKPYADYTGNYMDSPFMFDLVTKKKTLKKNPKIMEDVKVFDEGDKIEVPRKIDEEDALDESAVPDKSDGLDEKDASDKSEEETVLTDKYNPLAAQKFEEVSEKLIYSKGPDTIIEDIKKALSEPKDKTNLDVVFALDATGSMKDDLDKLKAELVPELQKMLETNEGVRVGLLFYRDYGDTFRYMDLPVKVFGFTNSLKTLERNLNSIRIVGKEGGDIPEAVYEAVYAATEFYSWRADSQKKIVLIGDAEPHPFPRGSAKYSQQYVMSLAEAKGIKITAILLPQD